MSPSQASSGAAPVRAVNVEDCIVVGSGFDDVGALCCQRFTVQPEIRTITRVCQSRRMFPKIAQNFTGLKASRTVPLELQPLISETYSQQVWAGVLPAEATIA